MDNNNDIQSQLRRWAETYVPLFNECAKAHKDKNGRILKPVRFYTQSCLTGINRLIDTLIIGKNPAGFLGDEETFQSSPEKYLEGNFCNPINEQGRFFDGVRKFLGYGTYYAIDGLEDVRRTVWTNLTPFESKQFNHLPTERIELGIKSTIELIGILQPKRIILLGKECFDLLTQYSAAEIERYKIVRDKSENGVLEIGSVNGFPAIQLPHPSGSWGFHGFIVPIFVRLWELHKTQTKTLKDCAIKTREQLTRLEPIYD